MLEPRRGYLYRHVHRVMEETQRALIVGALRATQGNRTQAARLLETERTNLLRLIRRLEIRE